MKQKPILFSTPMVQAILAGSKTQTRRVIKPQPQYLPDEVICEGVTMTGAWSWRFGTNTFPKIGGYRREDMFKLKMDEFCPYGKPGDILWVRETWANLNSDFAGQDPFYVYKESVETTGCDHGPVTWKPSIYMPKEACRIFLRITKVRVQRLNEIGRQDALSEGIENRVELEDTAHEQEYYQYKFGGERFPSAVQAFCGLWQSINGPESWEANPWVWVVEFEKCEAPEGWPI